VGTGGCEGGLTRDWWEYDVENDGWAQLTDFGGTARQDAVAAAYNGKVYVGTGWEGGLTRDWWEYDIATSTWTQLTDFGGVARRSAVAAAYNGKVYKFMWVRDITEHTYRIGGNMTLPVTLGLQWLTLAAV